MESWFGKLRSPPTVSKEELESIRDILDIPPTVQLLDPEEVDRFHHLEYLGLKGDFYWFNPDSWNCDDDLLIEQPEIGAMTAEELDELQKSADEAGVHLPQSFVRLYTDQKLLDLMVKVPRNIFTIRPLDLYGFSHETSMMGYVLVSVITPFDYPTREWHLFVLPGEESIDCVFSLIYERNEEAGGIVEGPPRLAGLGFEEWLATYYFEAWLMFLAQRKSSLNWNIEPLKEYVREVYVRKTS